MKIRLDKWEESLLMVMAVLSFYLALCHVHPWNCMYFMGFGLAVGILWGSEPVEVEVNEHARK